MLQAAQRGKRERFLVHHQTLFLDVTAVVCWLDGWLRAGGRASGVSHCSCSGRQFFSTTLARNALVYEDDDKQPLQDKKKRQDSPLNCRLENNERANQQSKQPDKVACCSETIFNRWKALVAGFLVETR